MQYLLRLHRHSDHYLWFVNIYIIFHSHIYMTHDCDQGFHRNRSKFRKKIKRKYWFLAWFLDNFFEDINFQQNSTFKFPTLPYVMRAGHICVWIFRLIISHILFVFCLFLFVWCCFLFLFFFKHLFCMHSDTDIKISF